MLSATTADWLCACRVVLLSLNTQHIPPEVSREIFHQSNGAIGTRLVGQVLKKSRKLIVNVYGNFSDLSSMFALSSPASIYTVGRYHFPFKIPAINVVRPQCKADSILSQTVHYVRDRNVSTYQLQHLGCRFSVRYCPRHCR